MLSATSHLDWEYRDPSGREVNYNNNENNNDYNNDYNNENNIDNGHSIDNNDNNAMIVIAIIKIMIILITLIANFDILCLIAFNCV